MTNADSIDLLSRLAYNGNLPHALLFAGLDAENKQDIALKFSKWLLHPKQGNEGPGDSKFSEFYSKECACDSCFQVSYGTHPDFLLLDNFSVQIDEIRSLKSKFSTSALLSDRKIAIVNSAEAMTNQAANSFLKLLEEPRGNVLLILIAPFRSRVLPTIASRTLEIRFSSNSPSASGGRKENIPVKHIEAVRVLQAGMLCDKFALVKKYNLENKPALIEVIDIWLIELRDKFIKDQNKNNINFIKKILAVKKSIATTNANPQLLLEGAFLEQGSQAR